MKNKTKIWIIFGVFLLSVLLVPFVNALVICSSSSDCDDSDLYTFDKCNNPGMDSSYCSYETINCVSDNDCGFNGFFGDEFCSGSDVFKLFQSSTCINPGTTNSYCEISNSSKLIVDCGENHCDNYGDNYCKGNDVYKSRWCYITGCLNGICTSDQNKDEQFVKSCQEGCSNGNCINEAMCSSDADCASPLDLQYICKNDDVYTRKTVSMCNNPGTLNSFCSSSLVETLFKTCRYGCSNGACNDENNEECDSDSDCGRIKTEYQCDGDDVIKVVKTPECVQNACKTEDEESFVKTCREGCASGKCREDINHRKTVSEDEEILPEPAKTSISYAYLNDTNNIQLTGATTSPASSSSFNDYFWLIFLLVLVFLILISILIAILRR